MPLEDGWPGTGRSSPRPVGTLPPVQVTFWITASSPEPVCCTYAVPARAGDERVDREARRDGQHDLRRRRALLLGRDGEAVQLKLLRQRDGRADARVGEGADAPASATRRGSEHDRRSAPPPRDRRQTCLGIDVHVGRLLSGSRFKGTGTCTVGGPRAPLASRQPAGGSRGRRRKAPAGTAGGANERVPRAARRAAAPRRAGARPPRGRRRRGARARRQDRDRVPVDRPDAGSGARASRAPRASGSSTRASRRRTTSTRKSAARGRRAAPGRSRGGDTSRRPSSSSRTRTAAPASVSAARRASAAAARIASERHGQVRADRAVVAPARRASTDCGASA